MSSQPGEPPEKTSVQEEAPCAQITTGTKLPHEVTLHPLESALRSSEISFKHTCVLDCFKQHYFQGAQACSHVSLYPMSKDSAEWRAARGPFPEEGDGVQPPPPELGSSTSNPQRKGQPADLRLTHLKMQLTFKGLPWWIRVKIPPASAGDVGSIQQSMGSQRARHNSATKQQQYSKDCIKKKLNKESRYIASLSLRHCWFSSRILTCHVGGLGLRLMQTLRCI